MTAGVVALGTGTSAIAAGEGQVRFFNENVPATDHYWLSADQNPSERQWLVDHYKRTRSYTTFFDRLTSWFPNAWLYSNSYAIYKSGKGTPDQDSVSESFFLHDEAGNRLYIPWGCGGGTCPQFAGDITNPAWRSAWIERLREVFGRTAYKGVFLDDVNMERKVSDGNGDTSVTPVNYQGQAVTTAMWQQAMADFMTEVRQAFPTTEILHNQVWFFAGGESNPEVQRAIGQADVIEIERGYHDPGIDTQSEFDRLRSFIRYVHSQDKGVVLDAHEQNDPDYALATYFLDANGRDYVSHPYKAVPDDWWSAGWDLDLGDPKNSAYRWQGLWRRDFARGSALVNRDADPAARAELAGSFDVFYGEGAGLRQRAYDDGALLGAADVANARTGSLAATAEGATKLWLFEEDGAGGIDYRTRTGSTWSDWANVASGVSARPAVASPATERVGLVTRGGAPAYNILFRQWKGSAWSAAINLSGNATSAPALAAQGTRYDVFARGADNALLWKAGTNCGPDTCRWDAGWTNLGGVLASEPAAVSWGSKRLDVFWRNNEDAISHRSWNGSKWSTTTSLGGSMTQGPPAVSSPASGKLDLFARGDDNRLWLRSYTSTNGWTPWEPLAASLNSSPTATSRRNNTATWKDLSQRTITGITASGGDGTVVRKYP